MGTQFGFWNTKTGQHAREMMDLRGEGTLKWAKLVVWDIRFFFLSSCHRLGQTRRQRSSDYCENHAVVFKYPLSDAQTTSKTTRCGIAFAHMTYDVIQNGAENADGRRKNLKTGHPWNHRKPKVTNCVLFRQTQKVRTEVFTITHEHLGRLPCVHNVIVKAPHS